MILLLLFLAVFSKQQRFLAVEASPTSSESVAVSKPIPASAQVVVPATTILKHGSPFLVRSLPWTCLQQRQYSKKSSQVVLSARTLSRPTTAASFVITPPTNDFGSVRSVAGSIDLGRISSSHHCLTTRTDTLRSISMMSKQSMNNEHDKNSSRIIEEKNCNESIGRNSGTNKILTSEWEGPTGERDSLERLCSVSLRACEIMTPLVSGIYQQLLVLSKPKNYSNTTGTDNTRSDKKGLVQKVKQDNSAFTIADGMVQRLLINVLFSHALFRDIVGEEDDGDDDDDVETDATSQEWWYQVQGLSIPEDLQSLVDSTRVQIESLATEYLKNERDGHHPYQHLTVFIDPIDGTREFSTGKGEQCSICIGFANEHGNAVAGVVYRPLTHPMPTWVAGAKCEGYAVSEFYGKDPMVGVSAIGKEQGGLLTSNGAISPFVESLLTEMQLPRIKSGGAGNKMMLLLDNSIQNCETNDNIGTQDSMLYIQDRGVSRWDTCAAEACLDAFGGRLLKLTEFLDSNDKHVNETGDGHETKMLYTYLASKTNLDFVSGSANLTKYNSALDNEQLQTDQKAVRVEQVKPYANLCGLVAFGKEWNTPERRQILHRAIVRAAKMNSPSFD